MSEQTTTAAQTPQQKAADMLFRANALQKGIDNLKNRAGNLMQAQDIRATSTSYATETFEFARQAPSNNKRKPAADYPTLAEFVAAQDEPGARLSAQFVADTVAAMNEEREELEAQLTELLTGIRPAPTAEAEAAAMLADLTKASQHVLADIMRERVRQNLKFGPQNRTPQEWYLIFSEEVGEVAKECVEIQFNDAAHPHANLKNYRKELIEAAAVAVAALVNFDTREAATASEPAPAPSVPEPCRPLPDITNEPAAPASFRQEPELDQLPF